MPLSGIADRTTKGYTLTVEDMPYWVIDDSV
jgi:hypothetical protein